MAVARPIMAAHGIDFMTGATMDGREMLNVMPLVFDRGDAAATAAADACMRALYDAFAAKGWGFYRAGIGYMDRVAEIHGAAQRDVNRRLKRAFDPAGIIAPGKSGIRL
jgi:4-cresol dehydrogenase (hydroxylating)